MSHEPIDSTCQQALQTTKGNAMKFDLRTPIQPPARCTAFLSVLPHGYFYESSGNGDTKDGAVAYMPVGGPVGSYIRVTRPSECNGFKSVWKCGKNTAIQVYADPINKEPISLNW